MIRLTSYELKQFKKISEQGAEAIIYANPKEPGILYRIYREYEKKDLNSEEKRTKYFISIKDKLPPEVFGPIEEVYVDGRFAGYTMMAFAKGKDIDMLANPDFIATNRVINKHSLLVMKRVNEIFRQLHKMGILIGDVSGGNIMIDIASIVNQNIPKVGFIDVVSWGVNGMFPPSTYTKDFTCPDSYLSDGSIKFSIKNENYALAVLNFLIITAIHPFGGLYKPKKRMRRWERMQKKLSILGPARESGEIGINPDLPSYDWMSPELKQHFLEIFEQGRKDDVYMEDIETLLENMKYCDTHKVYYDGRFNDCPICNSKAQVATPVVIQVATTGAEIIAACVFAPDDCNLILDRYIYVDNNGCIVHKATGRKYSVEVGSKVEFSKDGRFVFVSDEDEICVMNAMNGKQIAVLQSAYKSMSMVSGDYFYYVDTSNALRKVKVTMSGMMPEFVAYVRNAIFEVEEDGKFCAVSLYPGKAMIDTNSYRFEVKCPNYIKEYAIKRDNSSKTPQWLFVYKDDKKDEYHTWLLKDSKVAEEVEAMKGYDYTVSKLSNISIHRGQIFIPDENKIVGISTKTGKSKEFVCSTRGILSESSAIEFTGEGFYVTNRNKEYELK